MGVGERVLLAAIGPENVSLFPSPLLNKIWERKLLPAKIHMANNHGVRLFGLHLIAVVGSPTHRDFSRYAANRGFAVPCGSQFRFVVSDSNWDRLPSLSTTTPLLIAIQLQESVEQPSAHPIDSSHLLTFSSNRKLADDVADFLLDFSFCSGFLPSKILASFLETRSMPLLFQRKVEFAFKMGLVQDAAIPYVSFSSLARNGRAFGSATHLSDFCRLWDAFFLDLLNEIDFTREKLLTILLSYPTFKNQISPFRLKEALANLPAGIHHLVVQRRSLEARTNPKLRNKILPIFTVLDVRGKGRKRFGFKSGDTIPTNIRDAVGAEAIYLSRIYVGKK
ncbi:hypothetical protein [Rhizobium leguminosarum]|uniref:hypothetical protein n=1 Tax=Rhizobium leguminosarum TaxID=384 RepID=UPI001AECC926|nr:hypothetical protein [Rhizobium leguminosarum]